MGGKKATYPLCGVIR